MPFYQRLGEVPRKRHIQFRENGALLTEEVLGLEGFTGNEAILYHLHSPCRVKELGGFRPIEREEWVPEAHAHRHVRTHGIPEGGDAVSGRRLLMWNDDVEISLCRPAEAMSSFFRNGEGDECIFVHEGKGTLETIYDDVQVRARGAAALPDLRDARADRDPAPLPQRVRAAARGRPLLEPRPARAGRAEDPPRPGRAPRHRARPRRPPGLRARLPPLRRRRLGRLPLSMDVLDPRFRADHRPHPPAAAVAPDLPRPPLRPLLV